MDSNGTHTLLALDESACSRVQHELDELSSLYSRDLLFTKKVMSEMHLLDGLLYEAIRLCPPFLGGLKRTTKTIELTEDGLQIPKSTSLLFCQATGEGFDLSKAMAKKPQDLGKHYPSPALYGFLPFQRTRSSVDGPPEQGIPNCFIAKVHSVFLQRQLLFEY
jgi:hypothetical protein